MMFQQSVNLTTQVLFCEDLWPFAVLLEFVLQKRVKARLQKAA